MKSKWQWLSLVGSVLLISITGRAGQALPRELTAEEIVRKVDEVRNPADSYLMKVEVSDKSEPDETSAFEVSISGNRKTLVRTIAPPRDRGRNMLMLDEEMWAFIPNLKRAVRVSLSQRLSGQAANGDISRMRWSGDYEPKLEKSAGGEWVLLLSARKKGLTYEKIRIFVEQKTFRPKKAEFLTPAGKTLKIATYGSYREMAGKVRPTEILIQDAIRPSDASVIKIKNMETRDFPDSLFNQNSLK